MSDLTHILAAVERGDPAAADRLLPLVYDELRRLAAARLAAERPGQTLDATALVHEAYLRLAGGQEFDHRGHFFAAAAEAMRRILAEAARKRGRLKRGGGHVQMPLDGLATAGPQAGWDLVALDAALTRLGVEKPCVAKLVELRYFAGLTAEQAAEVLGVSLPTANRHWRFARSWLYDQLSGDGEAAGE